MFISRYGRITVSTLESKLASCEKDVSRLTKALERSDKYIEELESELQTYRDGGNTVSEKGGKHAASKGDRYVSNGDYMSRKALSDSKVLPSKEARDRADQSTRKQLFADDKVTTSKSSTSESKYYYLTNGHARGGEDESELMDYETDKNYKRTEISRSGANKGQKRVTFNLRNEVNATTSFDLELPSPVKTSGNRSNLSSNRPGSPVKGVLKNGAKKPSASEKSDDNLSTDHSRTYDDSLSNSYNEKPSKRSDLYSKDDDLVYMKARAKSKESSNMYTKTKRKYSADDSALSEPSDLNIRGSENLLKRSTDLVKRASDLERYSSGTRRTTEYDRSNDDSDDIDKADLDDTIHIESELGELDISLTPELSDCMKLLNRAEKKVHHRDSDLEDDLTGYTSTKNTDLETGYRSSLPRSNELESAYRTSTARSSGVDTDFRNTAYRDSEIDSAFRASTGSFNNRLRTDDLTSDYKTGIESKFTASLDTYSRGRHHRSGSLDNLLVDIPRESFDRPGSALPTTSNMYQGLQNTKYSGGLTTGRTKLTRTPSFDNLLMSRQNDGISKYYGDSDFASVKSRLSLPGYTSQRQYRGENEDTLDVKAPSGTGSTNVENVTKGMEGIGMHRVDIGKGSGNRSEYEAVLQARAKSLAEPGIHTSSLPGRHGLDVDIDKKAYSTSRLSTAQDGEINPDRKYASGRSTPILTSQSDFSSLTKANNDKFTLTGSGSSSGRLTPNLPSSTNLNAHSKPNYTNFDYTGSGPSSLPADISHKPPIAGRPYDSSRHSLGSGVGYTSSVPSATGAGYSSMPSYSNGPGMTNNIEHPPPRVNLKSDLVQSSRTNTLDVYQPDFNNYVATKQKPVMDGRFIDDKYSSASDINNASNLPVYNANRVDIDNYNYRNSYEYSSKVPSVDPNSLKPVLPASDNFSSAALPPFTGPSMASYVSTSFLPTTLTSMSSGSSYSTAISVPLTFTTTSSYSSHPSTSYPSKPMDPISEHYSYVSNISGDLSKSDTFALPEPKKRLFDSTDDLEMSLSPIKANKRY